MSEAKIKTALGRGGGMIVFTGQLLYYNLFIFKDYSPSYYIYYEYNICPSVPFAATVAVLIWFLPSLCLSFFFPHTFSLFLRFLRCDSVAVLIPPVFPKSILQSRFCNSQLSFSLYLSQKLPRKSIFLKIFPRNILSEWLLVLLLHSLTERNTLSTRSLKDFHKLFVEKYKKQTLQRK